MKRTLKIEVSAANVFDAEDNEIYGARTQEQLLAHIDEMRTDIARWFTDNMEDSAVINVKVSVEEVDDDGTTQESAS